MGAFMKFFSLFFLILLTSCSLGVTKSGGERSYVYNVENEYSREALETLSSQLVASLKRDPIKGKLEDLFSSKQTPLKRVGILVFETSIQPARDGLSKQDKIYLSAQGKQLLTEKLLSIWEQSLPILGPELEYVPTSKLKQSKTLKTYGLAVEDHIKAKRDGLMPDDIFYIPPGKTISMYTVLNPRGMRDLSLALVPASELMQGPKYSEHMKHAVNDLAKEFKLDAVLVLMSELKWSSAHTDKHSGEIIPEEVKINLKATTLVPLSGYHKRLEALGEKRDLPSISVSYRAYEANLKIPVNISIPDQDQGFDHIEKELLTPMLKTYKDLSQMMGLQIVKDLKKTH
jgi:hypothetical protein